MKKVVISPMHIARPLNEAPVLHNSHIYVSDFSNKNSQGYDFSFYAKREIDVFQLVFLLDLGCCRLNCVLLSIHFHQHLSLSLTFVVSHDVVVIIGCCCLCCCDHWLCGSCRHLSYKSHSGNVKKKKYEI